MYSLEFWVDGVICWIVTDLEKKPANRDCLVMRNPEKCDKGYKFTNGDKEYIANELQAGPSSTATLRVIEQAK